MVKGSLNQFPVAASYEVSVWELRWNLFIQGKMFLFGISPTPS